MSLFEAPAVRGTILVVDDAATIRTALRAALEDGGHTVLEAADGSPALDVLAHTPVDLVITDYNMAEMDGLALLGRIRAQWSREALPVLVLTTEAGDGLKLRGRELGANGWLVKPFDPARLRDVVSYVLTRRGTAPPVQP